MFTSSPVMTDRMVQDARILERGESTTSQVWQYFVVPQGFLEWVRNVGGDVFLDVAAGRPCAVKRYKVTDAMCLIVVALVNDCTTHLLFVLVPQSLCFDM